MNKIVKWAKNNCSRPIKKTGRPYLRKAWPPSTSVVENVIFYDCWNLNVTTVRGQRIWDVVNQCLYACPIL